ncbi:MAG: YigZ family protein [Atribacterota bacterium]
MRTIARETRVELMVERSRFVALSFRIESQEEGKAKLKEVQNFFPGATHYVYAWRLRENGEFASDGGEPAGSAGRPVLGALRHSGLIHTLVVVVRYFGGKKLGIRGLIEAYGKAARMVLERSGLAEYARTSLFTVTLSPPHRDFLVNRLRGMVQDRERVSLDQEGKVLLRVLETEREAVQAFLGYMHRQGKVLHCEEREGFWCDT